MSAGSVVTGNAVSAEHVETDLAAPVGVERAELTGSASAYKPINPIRVLDTRRSDKYPRLWVESAISFDPVTDTGVADAAGVDPGDITAVIVNVTMINAGDAGFGTVWPTGSERLLTSTNNVEFAGHTIPNLAIAPLGLERKISIFASTTSNVAVDVLGVFVASGPTAAGRFEPLGPTRAFDTRDVDINEFRANETRNINLTNVGVPRDATGVVLNVTAIRSRGAGFYRVWSAGDPEPSHSSVNVLGVDYQAGNQVISGVENGRISVGTNVGGGLTIDVTGYFTGASSEVSTDGLFVPFTPGRLVDTRADSGPRAVTGGSRVGAEESLEITVASRLDIPETGAKALALNVTAVRADDRGFVSLYPSDSDAPDTSSLNFTQGGQTVPNHAITSVSEDGRITAVPSELTHLLIDATGYFLDATAEPPVASETEAKVVDPGSFVPEPLGAAPGEGPYDFLFDRGAFTATGQRPSPTLQAQWPTCQPIRYALNIDLAETNEQVEVLISSIESVEAATGIDFQFAGVTSSGLNIDNPILLAENFNEQLGQRLIGQDPAPFKYLPPDNNGQDSVSLVIGFSDGNDTLELSSPGTIGVGGSLRFQADPDGRAEAFRGFALIDIAKLYEDGPNGAVTLSNIQATTTHELGHMVGLGHVSDFNPRTGSASTLFQGLDPNSGSWPNATLQDQLMYPALNPGAGSDFDTGDRLGLWEMYSESFCPSKPGEKPGESPSQLPLDVIKSVDDFG